MKIKTIMRTTTHLPECLKSKILTTPHPGEIKINSHSCWWEYKIVQSLWKKLETQKSLSQWQPTPVFLPGEPHGGRSLVGYSQRGCKESDTTELLHFAQIHWKLWTCKILHLGVYRRFIHNFQNLETTKGLPRQC